MDVAGQRVLVVGMQASGQAAARLAVAKGAHVTGVDLKADVTPIPGVDLKLGPHDRRDFLGADLIVVSPGVPASQPDLAAAVEAGVPVIGELGFALSYLHQPVLAITGTNGKSTVTWFTGQLLEAAGFRPFVGGNLGNPPSNAVGHPHDVLVIEVSSYQLEFPGTIAPKAAVILNVTPDHLGRHGDLDTYASVKARLFDRQGPDDLAIVPFGDERLRLLAERRGSGRVVFLDAFPGIVRTGRSVRIDLRSAPPGAGGAGDTPVDLDLSPLTVPGDHNRDNAATAALLALHAGADPARIQAAIGGLTALAHRMEVVATQGDVLWINDSKATNVDATAVGLRGLERRAVVLLGGQAKGRGFATLVPLLARHRAVVTFGGDGPAIADELEDAGQPVVRVGSMADAVDTARGLARPGDAVLLSPGCASFDAFQNFEHRGRVFRQLVTGEGT